mmetsp:Transcript_121413/g.348877  ORF Transcript_121413/g.348877 Transcript_121413/m.348877 type:complete len:252 (+) Transcript_121413:1458-2213(+)
MLALCPTALHLRRSLCDLLLRLLVEQRLHHCLGPDHRRLRGVYLVLRPREGQDACAAVFREDDLQVSPWLRGVRVFHRGAYAVHPVCDEVLGEAGSGAKEPVHDDRARAGSVLFAVFRGVHRVLEQECIHPDRAHGKESLCFRDEGLRPHHEQRPPLRDGGHLGRHHPQHRLRVHHGGHRVGGVLPRARHARGGLPGYASARVRLHGLPRLARLHDRLRPRGRHFAAMLPEDRGGQASGHRFRATKFEDIP